MLRALFIVYAVASSAVLDDATAADAETRAEHIVQLCAEHQRAPPPSHLELEPVARPPPRRARSPPRRTAVLGASAAPPPRRGRPTLLGVEDSTFISGAEDF